MFFILLILSFPFVLLSVILKELQPLGRLGVVYDQAGKARVIALCNYWIQLGLYPIHKDVFSFLKTLETDGTFDQHKPLDNIINNIKKGSIANQNFSCFDLSAATDRLPIELQVAILNSLKKNLGNK